jgi:uncharacterized protein YcbX
MLQISELYIYPIKSLAGIAVTKALVTKTGFEYDRRWMLVDENCRFISQREVSEMALLQVSVRDNGLMVTHKTKSDSTIIPFQSAGRQVEVTVWDDTCMAEYVSAETDKWFSDMLGLNCRLVYMPDETKRVVDQRYAPADAITSFSDAYPFLIVGQASLDNLNSRLDQALPMNRFRPNIVFTGGQPYEEDRIAHFTVNDIDFFGVKLCARCNIITIDQETAQSAKEPTKTLAGYRKKNNKILFGQNLVHEGAGIIAIGDHMQIMRMNYDERFIISEAVKS